MLMEVFYAEQNAEAHISGKEPGISGGRIRIIVMDAWFARVDVSAREG